MSDWVKLTEKEKAVKKRVLQQLKAVDTYAVDLSVDNIPSYSSSIITINPDSTYKSSKMIRTVNNRIDKEIIYARYVKYLDNLQKLDLFLRELIEQRCFWNTTFENIAWKRCMDRNRISNLFNKACLILAYFDSSIDFTANDYYSYCKRNHTQSYALQEVVKLLLVQYDNNTKKIAYDIAPIFNILTAEINNLYKAKDFIGVKKFLKLIYSIAYKHPEINFGYEEFINAAKKTEMTRRELHDISKKNIKVKL